MEARRYACGCNGPMASPKSKSVPVSESFATHMPPGPNRKIAIPCPAKIFDGLLPHLEVFHSASLVEEIVVCRDLWSPSDRAETCTSPVYIHQKKSQKIAPPNAPTKIQQNPQQNPRRSTYKVNARIDKDPCHPGRVKHLSASHRVPSSRLERKGFLRLSRVKWP